MMPLIDFWAARSEEYSELLRKAVNFLLPFPTTYLCESGSSHLFIIKTKYRNTWYRVKIRVGIVQKLLLKLTQFVARNKPTHPINIKKIFLSALCPFPFIETKTLFFQVYYFLGEGRGIFN